MRRTIALALPALAVGLLALTACGEARPIAEGAAAGTRCAGCHGDAASVERLSGAHAAHVAQGGIALACAECHPVPGSVGAPGHADGEADLLFGARAGGAAARWNPAGGTCAVACHGSLGGDAAMPVWTAGDGAAAACGACHGVPPPAPHVASAACASCHLTAGTAGAMVAGGPHVNGQVDLLGGEPACGSCHGIPPPSPHTASTSCGSCHPGYTATSVDAALHRNGRVDATAQACGSCHGIPPSSGEHRKHADKGLSCGTCHAGASSTSGGPAHLDGVTNVSAPGWNASQLTCANACHGEKEW